MSEAENQAEGEAQAGASSNESPGKGEVVIEKLSWRLEYLGAGGALRHAEADQVMGIGEGAYFAVEGALPERLPLVYVLQLENPAPPHAVRIGLLAIARELGLPGVEVRLPREGTFLFNHVAGQVVVLAAERALSLEQLTALFKGREPPPDPVRTGST